MSHAADDERQEDRAERSARDGAARMWAADYAAQHLGIEVHDIAPGHASAHMQVTKQMINGHGICHGGYVFLLADTAFAYACNTYGHLTVAAGADITFVAAVREGETLTAVASERARYGRSGIYDVTVAAREGDVVAEFRGRSRSREG